MCKSNENPNEKWTEKGARAQPHLGLPPLLCAKMYDSVKVSIRSKGASSENPNEKWTQKGAASQRILGYPPFLCSNL